MPKPKIIFLGSVPPPHMGTSIATETILKSKLKDDFELIHLDTSDHRDLTTLNRIDFMNIFLALKHYCVLIYLLMKNKSEMVYLPVSQTTIGYLRDAGFILISKIFGNKVLCHLHGGNFRNWYHSTNSLIRWAVRGIHSLVDGQIVLGENLRQLFSGLMQENKIYVVPNGADYEFERKRARTTDSIRALYLANFIRSKGVMDALKAVPLVCSYRPEVEFIFVGGFVDDLVRKEMESFRAAYPDLPVRIEGSVTGKKKFEFYSSSDIFLFPTYYPPEGHPLVIVEAMAAGLPIVSTDQGAITESVIDGVNGFIVDKQNPVQIAEKLKILIQNKELRIRMGKESRRLYEEKFTEEKMVQNLKACFEQVLSA